MNAIYNNSFNAFLSQLFKCKRIERIPLLKLINLNLINCGKYFMQKFDKLSRKLIYKLKVLF